MSLRCCVPNCKTNSENIASNNSSVVIFSFPNDLKLKQKWIAAIPRKNWLPTKASTVCILHFKTEHLIIQHIERMNKRFKRYMLAKDAIPSIFTNVPNEKNMSINKMETKRIKLEKDFSGQQDICRTCLNKSSNLTSLFQEGRINNRNFKLIELLKSITSLEISETDEDKPSGICNKCIFNLSQSYLFQQDCLKSDRILNSMSYINTTIQEEEVIIPDEDIFATVLDVNIKRDSSYDATDNFGVEIKQYIDDYDSDLDIQSDDNVEENKMEVISDSILTAEKSTEIVLPKRNRKSRDDKPSNKRNYRNGQNTFECNTCGKILKYRHSYLDHLEIHAKESKYFCKQCDLGFKTKFRHRSHMAQHDDSNPFTCSFCKKRFVKKSSLKLHELVHTGEKPFKCTSCDYSARVRSNLKIHMRSHTGERPYKCHLCEKGFTRSDTLDLHIKLHSERGHECPICEKTFRSESFLKYKHIPTHNKEPNPTCELCLKIFPSKKALKLHSTECTMDYSVNFSCNICFKKFKSSGSLGMHQIKMHKNEEEYDKL